LANQRGPPCVIPQMAFYPGATLVSSYGFPRMVVLQGGSSRGISRRVVLQVWSTNGVPKRGPRIWVPKRAQQAGSTNVSPTAFSKMSPKGVSQEVSPNGCSSKWITQEGFSKGCPQRGVPEAGILHGFPPRDSSKRGPKETFSLKPI
jgi:hypothetical protein